MKPTRSVRFSETSRSDRCYNNVPRRTTIATVK